jgi:flagellar basal body rod protein FlgC
MSSITSIGISGLRAAEALASAAAANIVHAGSDGRVAGPNVQPADAAFQTVSVVTYDLGRDGQPGGVGYTAHQSAAPTDVATPSVDVPAELVSLAQAKYQFYSSVAVIGVGDEMMRAVINLVA